MGTGKGGGRKWNGRIGIGKGENGREDREWEGRIGSGKGGGRTTRWESGCQHRQYPSSINRRLCTDGIEWNGNWEQGNNISMGNIVGIF